MCARRLRGHRAKAIAMIAKRPSALRQRSIDSGFAGAGLAMAMDDRGHAARVERFPVPRRDGPTNSARPRRACDPGRRIACTARAGALSITTMPKTWLEFTSNSAPMRRNLPAGLTRISGPKGEIPLAGSGSDALHIWDHPPKLVFAGGGDL